MQRPQLSEKNIKKLINIELEYEKEVLFLNQTLWETIIKTGKKMFLSLICI